MKIEKICEYFNDIGILQLENINRFLKIYTQLSQNKYKNKSDKLILALFSYITLISKNEQQLYDICKNIVNCFSNNLILYRYRALNMFNNIFKNKIHLKYILFLSKLNSYIYNKNRKKIKYIHLNQNYRNNNSNPKREIRSNDNENDDIFNTNKTSKEKNNYGLTPKQKRININNQFIRKNNVRTLNNISDDDKECTFSPKINHYYNSKIKTKNPDFYTSNNISNDINNNNDNSFHNKFIPFKNSANYGYNNKINYEIEKMLTNMSKYSNNPNNSKYLPQKTLYRKQINNLFPSNSYYELSSFPNINYNNFSNFSNNNYSEENAEYPEYHYYDEDYDFYKNEKEHVKKVQDKILQLKLEKMDKISRECTFSPEINKNPKYLNNYQNNNYLNVYSASQRNYFKNNNSNNLMNNSLYTKRKASKNKNNKINEEYADDYYNIYPKRLNNNKKRPRSYSGSKSNNEYSIYKARKEELSKLFKEQYPFMPNIKYNKNVLIKSTFDERQKKFLKDKQEIYKQKEKEELAQIKEFQKRNRRPKTDSKEVVKRLYDDEAVKIKKRLKEEKEKLKKKKVIDWSKKRKKYSQLYPEDFKNIKKKKINDIQQDNKKEENYIDFSAFASSSKGKKKENEKKNDENNNAIDFSTYSNDKNIKKRENKSKKKEIKKEDNIIDFNNFNKVKKGKIIKNNGNDKINENENSVNINKNQQLLIDKIKDEHVIGFKNNISNNSFNNNISNTKKEEDYTDNKEKDSIKESQDLKEYIFRPELSSINTEERVKNFENNDLLDNLHNKGGIKSTTLQEMRNKHLLNDNYIE